MSWVISFVIVFSYIFIARRVYVYLVYKTYKGRNKKNEDLTVLEDFLDDVMSENEFLSTGLFFSCYFWPLLVFFIFLIWVILSIHGLYFRKIKAPKSLRGRIILKFRKEMRSKRGKHNG